MPPKKRPSPITPETARRIVSALVLTAWLVLQRHTQEPVAEPVQAQAAPTPTTADAGTGDSAMPPMARGKPVPPKPFRRQKRAPCDGSKVEINGACWGRAAATPPCPDDQFEWKSACYFPIDESGMAMSDPQ